MIDWHRPINRRERLAAIIGAAAGAAWAIIGLTAILIASPSPVGGQEAMLTIALDEHREGRADRFLTTVTLDHPDPGECNDTAEAVVRITNRSVNGSADNATYPLVGAGTVIDLEFEWDRMGRADRFAVTPEPHLIAVPEELWLDEYASGTICLHEWNAEGM